MSWFKAHSLLDKTFEIGLLLKGLDGALEILGGILLLLIRPGMVVHLTNWITGLPFYLHHEEYRDIIDKILGYSNHLVGQGRTFAILFLFFHGIVKIILVVGLLRNQRWAYPFAFVTLGLFIVYQIYLIAIHVTITMILLTLFDLFIVYLTAREYQKFRNDHHPTAEPA